MKFILITLLIFQYYISFPQTTQLQPGDIAIIGFNFKNPDEFSFITFVDLNPGTIIYFTDCGWKNNNTFRTGEGVITYTVPASGESALDVITFNSDPGFTVQGVGGFFGFSVDGDQILAYQGSFASPNFIFAINNNGSSWQADATDNNTSALPEGLTNGINAVAINESVNSSYNCMMETGSKDELLAYISNASNWTASNIDRITLPTGCFDNALPLHLISFDVKNDNAYNLISFSTSDENQIHEYILERSKDGNTFAAIAFINPVNNYDVNNYFYKDYYQSSSYYRLVEVDWNGSKRYFSAVYVSTKEESIYGYLIYNSMGELIIDQENNSAEIENIRKQVNLLTNGLYIIKLIYSNGTKTIKQIKE